MYNFLKKFTLTIFVLVVIHLSIFGFYSLLTGDPINQIAEAMSIYNVKTVTIGNDTQTFLIFNIKNYLTSIAKSVTINIDTIKIDIPISFQPKWNDVITAVKSIFNILIYAFNWIIYITNLLILAPIKLLLSPIIFLLSIIGIDLTNINLITLIQRIYQINIPYIPLV